ncbi:MAG: BBP7 family outer membrane beta-barrel protein [Planctomycetales bacterium]|nr:BBP7 family outer membrane beta-barrel protein [Planctomycetales bacterium]
MANPVQQTAYFGDTNAMGDTFIEGSAASNVSLPAGGGLMSGCGGAGCASGCSDCCGFDDGCGLGTCGSMCGCLGLYGSVEYLMWWEKGDFLPPLVASSPDGTSSENTGVVGFSNALFGDETFNNDLINGFRVTLGTWVNGNNNLGVIGRYFNTEDAEASFSGDSNRFPRLGRPFFNTFTNEEDSLLLGFPDEITGDVTATFRSQARGAEANIRKLYTCGGNYRVDVVYGYRYMGIDESVRIDNTLRFIDPQSIQVGTSIEQFDLFDIENEFHGGELGFMGHSIQGCWAIDFIAKVALGNTTQRTSISGQSITTPATGSALTTQGGLLTQPSNIGMHEDNQFTVIPEFTATASYALTYNLDLSIGYTFLYVNHVARPSNAIDRSVNLTQQTALDGELRPVFPGTDSDYLLQGINFGLNFRY